MTSAFGRPILICSARSRRNPALRALPEIRDHLRRRGLEHEVRHARGPGDATLLARAAVDEGKRFVVAVGGDETVNAVVNGVMGDGDARARDVVLGVVASGPNCDFVRTFGIPSLPGHAVAHLDGPESFAIDVGKLTCVSGGRNRVRYFANMAQVGLGARVASLAARLPRALGPTAYPLALWTSLATHRATDTVVDLVDRTFEGAVASVVVANGQFFGGGMKIAPRAAPTDGLLDVLIDRTRRMETIALVPRVYRGEHLPHPDITLVKRVRVSVTAARPLRVNADGAPMGETPATFEVVRDALRLKV